MTENDMSETKTDSYWIALPGSDEPPAGPLTRADVLTAWKAGRYPDAANVCSVNSTEWRPISSLLPSRSARAGASASTGAARLSRKEAEAPYTNLATVGGTAASYGAGLRWLGALLLLGGALLVMSHLHEMAYIAGGFFVALVGIGVHVGGVLVAAAGEALIALRDVAASTRLVADREG